MNKFNPSEYLDAELLRNEDSISAKDRAHIRWCFESMQDFHDGNTTKEEIDNKIDDNRNNLSWGEMAFRSVYRGK